MATAIQAIYRDMEYAKSLIKKRDTAAGPDDGDDAAAADEESWTFVEDDDEMVPELAKRIAAWDGVRHKGESERDVPDEDGGAGRKQKGNSISKVSKGLLQKASGRDSKSEKAAA